MHLSSPENASSSSFNLSNISTASSRKVKPIGYSTPSSSQSITGYRIIDVEILNIVFSVFMSIVWSAKPKTV